MQYKYISTLILKNLLCLLHDFNQFYEEGSVKFSVSLKRLFFSDIEKLCFKNVLK